MDLINTEFHRAAALGDYATLTKILPHPSCDPMLSNAHGNTALMLAVSSNETRCIQALLLVSNVLAMNHMGDTALLMSVINENFASFTCLLPLSNALMANKKGLTALMHAAIRGNQSFLGILLPLSDVSTTDKFNLTAADHARKNNHPLIVALLEGYVLAKCERETLYAATPTRASFKKITSRI